MHRSFILFPAGVNILTAAESVGLICLISFSWCRFIFVSAFGDSVRCGLSRRALFEGLNKPNWGLSRVAWNKIY